jgi:AcrR family transcriptional regulator
VRSAVSHRQEDLTTKARIRDAALARFPRDGFGATTIRAVATDAGVSPALVVHHFGSKDGLREACDQHVVATFRETKLAAMEDENMFDPGFAADAYRMAQPLLRYFGWALARGHPAASDLFDEMLREGIEISRIAIERGMIVDSPDLETRTAVQMAMQLGMTVMHAHLKRNLGVDMLTAEGIAALTPTLLEIFSGLFNPSVLHQLEEVYGDRARDLLDHVEPHIES